MRILPSKQELIQLLGSDDFFLWKYYGKGFSVRFKREYLEAHKGANGILEVNAAETKKGIDS